MTNIDIVDDHATIPTTTTTPFLSHLANILSTYEHSPYLHHHEPFPTYDGPTDREMEFILRSLGAIVRRMVTAEDMVVSIKEKECWANGPGVKKRRSVGDGPWSPPLTPAAIFELGPVINGSGNGNGNGNGNGTGNGTGIGTGIGNGNGMGGLSASSTSYPFHACPTCGKPANSNSSMDVDVNVGMDGNENGNGHFENGMSANEELQLLKAQVHDVARVCNAVARGDLSQKITVTVQGVVMVQLKDVINTMVRLSSPPLSLAFCI
jgi:hypothetical protein